MRLFDELDLTDGVAAVRPGCEYAAQARVGVTIGEVRLRMRFLNASGDIATEVESRPRAATSGWVGIAVSATAPDEAVTARIELYGTPETEADVDGVRLVRSGTVRSLGTPLHTSTAHSAAIGPWVDGSLVVYAFVRGRPGSLRVTDLDDGHTVAVIPFPAGKEFGGAFSIVQTRDGTVYIPCSTGHLYAYTPGDGDVADVDLSQGGTSMLWDVAVDEYGRVFAGTYPRGEVVRYDPRDGSVARVSVADGLKYVRSVAVADGIVWAGLGTPARLFTLDADSLEVIEEIPLPEGLADQSMVYDTRIVRDVLVAHGSSDGGVYAFDSRTCRWTERLDTGRAVGLSSGSRRLACWLSSAGTVRYLDVDGQVVDTGVLVPPPGDHTANPIGYRWDGDTLTFLEASGTIYICDTSTKQVRTTPVEELRNEHRIHRLSAGSDGRIYVTGFAPGGLAWCDPATGELHETPHTAAKQAEYVHEYDRKVWLGTYPGADLLAFDPDEPCVPGKNPEWVASLRRVIEPEQDRPHAMAGTPYGLFVGTVPGYGKHGGALFLLPRGEQDPRVIELPPSVTEHSITALAYDPEGDALYIGTCLLGGLGPKPVSGVARLLRLALPDLVVDWDVVPDPAEPAITSLLFADRQRVWGITPGSVFDVDGATGKVGDVVDVAPFPGSSHAVWTSGKLLAGPHGRVVGQVNGQLVSFGESPEHWTVLATETTHGIAPLFARDLAGNSYFARDSTLFQLSPPDREDISP